MGGVVSRRSKTPDCVSSQPEELPYNAGILDSRLASTSLNRPAAGWTVGGAARDLRRKFPHGARVRRFRYRQSGQTVSLLPKCLAAHWSGTLAAVERAARAAAQASKQAAVEQMSAEYIGPAGALRWLRRRVLAVRTFLQAVRTVCPLQ